MNYKKSKTIAGMSKGLLCLLLAIVMVLALASCGRGAAPQPESAPVDIPPANAPDPIVVEEPAEAVVVESEPAPAPEAPAENPVDEAPESVDIMTPYTPYPETLVMTIGKVSSSSPNLVPGEKVDDNAMTRYIKDRVNVDIQLDWEIDGTEFPNRLALQITANALPDMFTLGQNNYLLFRQLQENNMLADLTEGSEKCLNDFIIATLATYEGRNLAPFRFGGELLAYAGGRYGYDSHNQLWLRTDWLEDAGLEPPTTIDDLENILRVWKNNPPNANYIGMPLRENQVGNVYNMHSFSPIFGAFGVYPNAWVKNADGQTIWGSVAPEAKQALEIMARWYADGLIDRQFVTNTASGFREGMIVQGQAGASFAPWWFPYTIGEFPVENPGGELYPFNAPVAADGSFSIMFPGAAGDYVMIRKGYSNPEAVFKVMNIQFDMWFELDPVGAELIMPNRLNNVSWTYMFPTSGFNVARNEEVPHAGAVAKQVVENGQVTMEVWNPMYVTMGESAASWAETGVVDGMNWIDYMCRYIASSTDLMYAPNRIIVLPEFYFVTESMADIKPNLDTLEDTAYLKIIMGEEPVDFFDQFVEDWYAQGGQAITDEVRRIVGN